MIYYTIYVLRLTLVSTSYGKDGHEVSISMIPAIRISELEFRLGFDDTISEKSLFAGDLTFVCSWG